MNLDLYGHFVGILEHLQDIMHKQQLDKIHLLKENNELRDQLYRQDKTANAHATETPAPTLNGCHLCGRTDSHTHTAGPMGMT